MLRRVAVVGVPAQDLVRAAHFYRDTLGLPMLPAGGRASGERVVLDKVLRLGRQYA